jgi:hypothetical protein
MALLRARAEVLLELAEAVSRIVDGTLAGV